jgi:Bacterial Ig domain/Ig-like domain from next to BRCA1 gene
MIAGVRARARVARLVAGAAIAAATLLATAPPASAVYAAEIVDFCCYGTVEAGDTFEQFYAMRNTGDQTWFRDGAIPIRIGTGGPRDHPSPFYTAGDWISASRLTALDSERTAPGEVGRFTWVSTAPQQVGAYTEYYEPLAESVNWMAPEMSLYLKYTVIAAQAPTLRITAVPARVKRGDAITVSADATDNRGIARVTFATGTQVVTATAPSAGTSGYAATLSSSELGPGTNNVLVRAYDLGGRETSTFSAFEVYEAPPVTSSTRLGAFTPYFATKTGRRGRLGSLIGLGDVAGLRPGSRLRIVCTKGCVRRVNESRKANSRGRVRLTLRRPLPLLGRTRIELRETMPGFVTRFQRYRMRRTRRATLARFLNAGCLSSEKPRTVTRCPQ